MRKISSLLLVLLAIGSIPALAQQKFENLDRIDSLVMTTVGANVGQPGGPVAPVDRRLRLAACPQIPTVEGPVFGAAVVKCDAVGWRIKVPLMPGGMASEAMGSQYVGGQYGAGQRMAAAQAPRQQALVKRGDPVQLIAGNANFSVSRAMVADEDGALGEMIRVREDRRSAPVIAQVVEMGMVRVPGFGN